MLSSCGVVAMSNESLPVQVTTDALAYGLQAVLQQVVDGEVRTVAFASRTLAPPERKVLYRRMRDAGMFMAVRTLARFSVGPQVCLTN